MLYVLQTLQLSAFVLGLTFAFSGIGSVAGASASGWFGRRLGVGPVIILCRWLTPVAYLQAILLHRSAFRHARLDEVKA